MWKVEVGKFRYGGIGGPIDGFEGRRVGYRVSREERSRGINCRVAGLSSYGVRRPLLTPRSK